MSDRLTSEAALVDADLAAPALTIPAGSVGRDVARCAPEVTLQARNVKRSDGAPLTCYPGGKNGAGVYQRLISLMPPHRVYIEAFLGSGAVLRRKKPACRNIGIDVDAGVIARHSAGSRNDCQFLCADALPFLREWDWTLSGEELVYCDPPYLGSARARGDRSLYRHEMMDEVRHAELLQILTSIPALVMISGYASALYEGFLRGWRRIEFQAMTRGGLATEVVWMNYPEPVVLHDYRFLGRDFHDRCRIGRKISRWTRRLKAMPPLERAAVISSLDAARVSNPDRGWPASAATATPEVAVCRPSTGKPWLEDNAELP